MVKYKIVLERGTCVGAFSCVAVGGGGDIWKMNEAEGKVDLRILGAAKTPERHEIITEDEELVKTVITSGEVCPTISIKVINMDTGENLVK